MYKSTLQKNRNYSNRYQKTNSNYTALLLLYSNHATIPHEPVFGCESNMCFSRNRPRLTSPFANPVLLSETLAKWTRHIDIKPQILYGYLSLIPFNCVWCCESALFNPASWHLNTGPLSAAATGAWDIVPERSQWYCGRRHVFGYLTAPSPGILVLRNENRGEFCLKRGLISRQDFRNNVSRCDKGELPISSVVLALSNCAVEWTLIFLLNFMESIYGRTLGGPTLRENCNFG